MELTLKGYIAELLAREARGRSMSIEALLILLMASQLPERDRVAFYVELSEALLNEANEHHRRGETVQAGEKLWGAVTALLNAIGELRGLPHYSHRDYVDIVETLVRETGDRDLARLFASAERLHANFYRGFLSDISFGAHKEDALKLINRLGGFVRKGD